MQDTPTMNRTSAKMKNTIVRRTISDLGHTKTGFPRLFLYQIESSNMLGATKIANTRLKLSIKSMSSAAIWTNSTITSGYEN